MAILTFYASIGASIAA
ncbi:Mst35Ba [Drosophila busckii]|uniref:Mst35Ba n=1 Tax=Drosophila busckii TaxID=30019 RepID=A0A0M3QTX9_DROBS|nr:Mst35Ba [Drosophila busckii]